MFEYCREHARSEKMIEWQNQLKFFRKNGQMTEKWRTEKFFFFVMCHYSQRGG